MAAPLAQEAMMVYDAHGEFAMVGFLVTNANIFAGSDDWLVPENGRLLLADYSVVRHQHPKYHFHWVGEEEDAYHERPSAMPNAGRPYHLRQQLPAILKRPDEFTVWSEIMERVSGRVEIEELIQSELVRQSIHRLSPSLHRSIAAAVHDCPFPESLYKHVDLLVQNVADRAILKIPADELKWLHQYLKDLE